MKLQLTVLSLGLTLVALSAQAGTIAIKDMSLVQETGSITNLGNVADNHHGDNHHGDNHHGDNHHGDNHHGDNHHGNNRHGAMNSSTSKVNLPSPQING